MKRLIIFLLLVLSYNLFWAQTVQNINNNGSIIHYKTFGKEDPILIINGGPGMNSNGFIPLAKKMGQSNKAIIYDQRGTGLSKVVTADSNSITLDLMIQDIEAIREDLNIEKWVILGHSFGGMLASYYATKHPNRIKGLILSSSGGIDMGLFSRIDITAKLTKKQRDSLTYWSNKISKGDTTFYARLQRGKYLAPAYLYNKANIPTVAKRLTEGNMNINQLVYQNMRKINFDCTDGLKGFKAPVLIIQGKEDIIDELTAITAKNAFQNATLVLLENCSHYGWLDRPEAYFENINSFLSKL